MTTLHPIKATDHIRATYLRYLKTIYPFQDRALRSAFWQGLEEPDRLVKGPLLESAPPFANGRTISELVAQDVLHNSFHLLCSDALPADRPLYQHQDAGISRVVGDKRNLIVATGTGSGKTETFLLPILDHLLREQAAGTLSQPGVRALLLYPMNALANDQLKRLRRVLAAYPAITFGRYTGETEEQDDKAKFRFYDQFPNEPLHPNEVISRRRMRAEPPHILLTNYAMLEYLLLRPEDCAFFDGDAGRHWRFIVLDEAHTYDGASGIEIAMLLRRVKERVVGSQPGRFRCIATSATLGGGRADFPAAARFASSLFGEPFEWCENDPSRQDVVEASRMPLAAVSAAVYEASPTLYIALRSELETVVLDAPLEAIEKLLAVAQPFVPAAVHEDARGTATKSLSIAGSDSQCRQRSLDALLYTLLRVDARVHRLQTVLGGRPQLLDAAARSVFGDADDASQSLIALVDLAVRARPDETSLSLFPARYHVFARALEGAFACLNSADHASGQPRVFLNRYERCLECAGLVVELASCVRCGASYIVGRDVHDTSSDSADGPALHILRQLTEDSSQAGAPAYFLVGDQFAGADEDDDVIAGDDGGNAAGDPFTICVRCGSLRAGGSIACRCGQQARPQQLRKVPLKGQAEPRQCLGCGARSVAGLIYRFLTGQDAPASVLATALYQQLPASWSDESDLPGRGRKLLIFSDSRQDAAFFAPYLERTYNQVLHRRLILKSLIDDPAGREGRLRLQDVAGRLQREAETAGLFTQRQSYDERQRTVTTWLMQELTALGRRQSLEGLGLLQFRLIRPDKWQPPAALLQVPWSFSTDEAWSLVALLLDTLRQQGVTTFPELVDPKHEDFAPRNVELFVREAQSDTKSGVLSWLPSRGSNRRLDLLMRLLSLRTPDLPESQRRVLATAALSGVWRHLSEAGTRWREHLVSMNRQRQGIVYRLSHNFWELVPLEPHQCTRCTRCRAISPINLGGLCPTNGCYGMLEPIDPHAVGIAENHYRQLYLTMEALPLSAEEHTAQWTGDEAGKVQERFVNGEINALSCSTTFELGVDVGELQAVLMRNVPPTTANYVQRAGRSGRRADSAAFALTYAQRRSHDLTHYNDPERIVAGRINPPRITLRNEKIARRHMQAVLLAAFFREQRDQHDRLFKSVGEFFQPKEGLTRAPELLRAFVEQRPDAIKSALLRILPGELHTDVFVDDWGWLATEEGDGLLDLLERAEDEVNDDLDLYRRLEAEAAADRRYGESQHYQSVARTIRGRSLLGYLASRNILPKYGFPTDVVELKTDHLHLAEAGRVQLDRDLRIAIAEYAPGAEVVAAKRIWTGGGLYKQPKKDWPVYNYAICPACGRFHRSASEIGTICSCGSPLRDRRHMYGTFIVPEFGFVAARDAVRSTGEARPRKLYASRVYFAEYAPPKRDGQVPTEPPLEYIPELSRSDLTVAARYSRFGKLALVNSGLLGRGFRICTACGFGEMAPEPPPVGARRRGPARPAAHKQPRTGRECTGFVQTHHLGHEFLTDVVELRFGGIVSSSAARPLWRSLVYALLEGAAEALGTRRDDLDGTLYYHTHTDAPAVVLFDNVPGGAGHVRRIAESLPDVLIATHQRVSVNCCGPETSCYECLRNYRNQPYHDELQRGLVLNFLTRALESVGLLDAR